MAAIHESLKTLGPVSFSEVPQDSDRLENYLSQHLSAGKFLIESVPQPTSPPSGRSRAVSSASSSAEISASTARIVTPTEHQPLQKDWGKPLKLSDKDNPLGISVFKLAGKDGRGAWFARRSVHEGLNFGTWKKGLQEEFEHSLQVQEGPGSGKVRGLGAEQRPESRVVDGVGTMDVWHVSAQFPGPSAPRDFVSLVMTSDTILGPDSPKHFMVVSKPCSHDNCPPQSGLVRGQYESVEFIREIQVSKKAASITDLRGTLQEKTNGVTNGDNETTSPGRARGRTIAFAESRGHTAKGESIDIHSEQVDSAPVEWIMITRSDPGGSVPRFLVERGTPGGIVSDASKFLDWACKRELVVPGSCSEDESKHTAAVLEKSNEAPTLNSVSNVPAPDIKTLSHTPETNTAVEPGILSAATTVVGSMIQKITGNATHEDKSSIRTPSTRSSISSASFASAEQSLETGAHHPTPSEKSSTSSSNKKANLSAQEKELLRLANRKAELSQKLSQARERAFRDSTSPTEKEQTQLAKTQAKHDRELVKAEERYTKSIRSIEDKRAREEEKVRLAEEFAARKEEDRIRLAERKERDRIDKEERKSVEYRYKSDLARVENEIKAVRAERDSLREDVRMLQAQNMKIVTIVGKVDGGERMLMELGIRGGGLGRGE